MNLGAIIFHGLMLTAAASMGIASMNGWGLADPQRAEKSVREGSERQHHSRGIHGGGIRHGK